MCSLTSGKYFFKRKKMDCLIKINLSKYLCVNRENIQRKALIIVLNFGKAWQTVDVSSRYNVPDQLKVLVASVETQYQEGYVDDIMSYR